MDFWYKVNTDHEWIGLWRYWCLGRKLWLDYGNHDVEAKAIALQKALKFGIHPVPLAGCTTAEEAAAVIADI